MQKNYSDSKNTQQLLDELRGLTDKHLFQNFVETHFPNWLLASTSEYCVDYPHLTQNWKLLCQNFGVEPQQIVIVESIFFDKDHTLMKTVCDLMTSRGYVVRRKEEFVGCEKCGKAIPTRRLWINFKNNGLPVPAVWLPTCSKC